MKKRIYLIALPLLLAACTPNENPGTSNAVPSSKDETVYRESFTDILDAITYLKEQKNYTLDVRISRDGSLMEEFDINYTRDGYYFGIKNGEYGYKAISEGVFAYEIYGKEIYFSELLEDDGVKYTDLWSSGLITSFADWSLSAVEAKKSDTIRAKDSRLAMMEMTGFDSNYYSLLETASAGLTNDGNFYFTYDMDIESYSYTVKATVLMVGGTITEKVDEAMNKGKTYFVPNANQKKARELFRGDNFTHIYYDENDNEAAWEKFHPEYYSLTVDSTYNSTHQDSPLIAASYVKIDNKYVPAAKRVLRGIYYCTIRGNAVSLMVGPNGEGYNNVPDMVSFLNYPKLLKLWNCFEYAVEEKTPISGYEVTYSFSRSDLAEDAANNFGLSTVLQNAGTTASNVLVSFKDLNKSSAKVSFRIIAANGQFQDFVFTDFGTTHEGALDNLLTTFLDPSEAPTA